MAQRDRGGDSPRERRLVNGLWIAAAVIVAAGFSLRILASLLSWTDLRILGVALIAVGIGVAGLAWLGERFAARHAP
ncbi:MAG TPA: hypothetical protein VN802_03185 [Stellaceae bacterium]|nr:hypothetical protein [Stellaceae bacterium]